MQQLVQGIHHFQHVGFREREQLFRRLKSGQQPEACLITCADSRIVPNLITNSEPGQLFIVRNVGNLVPCYGTSNNGELAAVEYAVTALGIQDLIVCGHTRCGAMQAVVDSAAGEDSGRLPSVQNWLRHADATREIVRAHYGHLKGVARVNAAAEENVLVQLEHLRTLPVVAANLSSGRIRLHAWMYKMDTGEIFQYEAETGQFVKFGDVSVQSGSRVSTGGRTGR
ncbi:MAG: carbonic anhydrase [Verrucomicrobiales bacterium]|nr:carbonic anhydrase [Verrucomicrobiales bacterium]